MMPDYPGRQRQNYSTAEIVIIVSSGRAASTLTSPFFSCLIDVTLVPSSMTSEGMVSVIASTRACTPPLNRTDLALGFLVIYNALVFRSEIVLKA